MQKVKVALHLRISMCYRSEPTSLPGVRQNTIRTKTAEAGQTE